MIDLLRLVARLLALLSLAVLPPLAAAADRDWPAPTRETRPWSYWWWLGSAVDTNNLTRELERYRAAGWGGVHIIPIYGAQGWDDRSIDYLSPKWMAMLRHAVSEGQRLGLGVDLTTGTGWCFGGPQVTDREANASVVAKTFRVESGARLTERLDRSAIQALVAFDGAGQALDLTDRLRDDGTLDWIPSGGAWSLYAIAQKPSGQRVKRAAPGGGGHMLNLFYAPALTHYLERFEQAFARYDGPTPRAMYHDSYEYNSNWSPDLFEQFARRRGYRLQSELPSLFANTTDERAARVQCDYRETLSDLMIETTLPLWVQWCHQHGMLTRNQAHGSPGHLLDLYALADIPETEMFHADRNKLVSKLASSAAHVMGRPRVAAETGTWLKEHFTETLADLKYLVDDLFLSGVNHVIYHGTCYSPDEVAWPGWLFYASTQMNPRNPIWRDVPTLNAYITRCQSMLQSGRPDNDVLLYWPLHDYWQQPGGLERRLTVHARGWLEDQPFGRAAARLWSRGYGFDYVSDRQIDLAKVAGTTIVLPGTSYRAIVVPRCEHIPLKTLNNLLSLAQAGATIIFEDALPNDVPGLADLETRHAQLRARTASIALLATADPQVRSAACGSGRTIVGDLEPALRVAGVAREVLVDQPGLMFIRRRSDHGRLYFIANRGETNFAGWLPLATALRSAQILDPITGAKGVATVRGIEGARGELQLRLPPGASVLVETWETRTARGPRWPLVDASAEPMELTGEWEIRFVAGGPELPPTVRTRTLSSWTGLAGEAAQRFAGTAVYSLTFDAPDGHGGSGWIDLGDVRQSARVRLNGRELGTLILPPFRVPVTNLRPKGNRLEVEVTNVAANRIRDLDRRKVPWRVFKDINFVNLNYKPFDASDWPLSESGLLGLVTWQATQSLGSRAP